MVIVAWDKTCRPHKEGGLGIRSLPTLNEASNLKMCRDMLKSKEECALILRKRVLRGISCIKYHMFFLHFGMV